MAGGRLTAAVNEERFTRRKLEVVFPAQSIDVCLRLSGIERRDIDLVAASTSDVAKTLGRWVPATKERYYQVRRRLAPPGLMARLARRAKYRITEWPPNALSQALSRAALRRELARCGIDKPLVLFDHHRCHAAAAAVTSGRDRSLVLTVDGVGDGISATVNLFEQGRLSCLAATPARHSLGVFFEHVTSLLNMRELEDEGKVMALADHALPLNDRANPMMALIDVAGLRFRTSVGGLGLRSRLQRIKVSTTNEQFAHLAQRVVERRLLEWTLAAVRQTGRRYVAFAGGVASNVKATRRVRLCEEVDEVFVFPHMGDGGLAVGAALCAALERDELVTLPLEALDLGPAFAAAAIREVLRRNGVEFTEPDDLASTTATLLAQDKVVLWFQGRMEYGPRALGHRSILARPDRPAIAERLNLILKRRARYQPFCPSILEQDAVRALSDLEGRPDRHMTSAYLVAPSWRAALAGVTSADGTCRPQIVRDDATTEFARLLHAARRLWGTGAVLNTSLNIHGEPLVHTPDEALSVFTRSGADAIVLGPYLAERRSP